jgi:hypothetical protein
MFAAIVAIVNRVAWAFDARDGQDQKLVVGRESEHGSAGTGTEVIDFLKYGLSHGDVGSIPPHQISS